MQVAEKIWSNRLSVFDRIIVNPVSVYPQMEYIDANDVSEDVRLATKCTIRGHEVWKDIMQDFRKLEDVHSEVGRRFCVYGWHKGELVGRLTFTEVLHHAKGYGKNDFRCGKFVFPKYAGTYESRAFRGDWIYAFFMSGLANYLYSFGKLDKSKNEEFILRNLNTDWPCVGKTFRSDSSEYIPYIYEKERISIDDQEFVLIEMNGHIFRTMDIYKYLRIDKRPKEVVYKTKEDMDILTEEVKRTICLT